MPQTPLPLPDFTRWPSFPFEGDIRVKDLAEPVDVEPPRSGEDGSDCVACKTPDDAYIWVSERWRVRGMERPTGLPVVLILECRSHLDIGDLPNLLAAELGVMTVRLERAIRSLDGVARVHVNRWGDGSAHLHMWFLARPYGRLQLRGTFLSLWDDILPVIPEEQWLENLALIAEWLAGFGGRAIAEPAHIHWQSPSTFGSGSASDPNTTTSTVAERPEGSTATDPNSTPADSERGGDSPAGSVRGDDGPPVIAVAPDTEGIDLPTVDPSDDAQATARQNRDADPTDEPRMTVATASVEGIAPNGESPEDASANAPTAVIPDPASQPEGQPVQQPAKRSEKTARAAADG